MIVLYIVEAGFANGKLAKTLPTYILQREKGFLYWNCNRF